MAEYISKETLLKRVNDQAETYIADGQNARARAVADIGTFVRNLPSADVVERKRGKWIDGDSRRVTAVCSVCGHLRLGNGADWCNKSGYFCEICGAKNGGEDDD